MKPTSAALAPHDWRPMPRIAGTRAVGTDRDPSTSLAVLGGVADCGYEDVPGLACAERGVGAEWPRRMPLRRTLRDYARRQEIARLAPDDASDVFQPLPCLCR